MTSCPCLKLARLCLVCGHLLEVVVANPISPPFFNCAHNPMVKWYFVPTTDMDNHEWMDMVRNLAHFMRGRWRSATGKFRKDNRLAPMRGRSKGSDSLLRHM